LQREVVLEFEGVLELASLCRLGSPVLMGLEGKSSRWVKWVKAEDLQ